MKILLILITAIAPSVCAAQSLSQSWCGLCFNAANKLYTKKKEHIDYAYHMCYNQSIFPEEEAKCRKDYYKSWIAIRVERREDKYDCWEWICGGNGGSTHEYDSEG